MAITFVFHSSFRGMWARVPSIAPRKWLRWLSVPIAMRASAAAVVFACLLCGTVADPDVTSPLHRLAKCTDTIGLPKCLSALAAYRAERALTTIKDKKVPSSIAKDVHYFPWERYANTTNDELFSQLCDGTEKLLEYKSLKFNLVSGYELKLLSSGNGTLNIDVFNRNVPTERGMKKWRKKFYEVVPLLLIPGLIMSAVLPFVLPAMKMMTVAVGMLNNMALSGAIFTLLRNNAFNDKYDKKVIYVNEGYHNEKQTKFKDNPFKKPNNIIEFGTHETKPVNEYTGEAIEVIEETPNEDWIKEYYGNKFFKVERDDWN